MDTMGYQNLYSSIANTGFVNIWNVSQNEYCFLFFLSPHEKERKWALVGQMSQIVIQGCFYVNIANCEILCPLTTFDHRLQSFLSAMTHLPELHVYFSQSIDLLQILSQ